MTIYTIYSSPAYLRVLQHSKGQGDQTRQDPQDGYDDLQGGVPQPRRLTHGVADGIVALEPDHQQSEH